MRILIVLILLVMSNPAMAANWYILKGGGTATQCDGHTNAVYPGSGTAQPCAFSDPRWLLGIGADTASNIMAGGDALYFGDAGQYVIGYPDSPNSGAGICGSSNPQDCYLGAVPGGSDASHRTKIYGYGYASCTGTKTQLWGENRTQQVLTLATGGSHFDIQCLDITDHSSCIEYGPLDGNVDGMPVQCNRDTYPQGPWANTGIYADTTSDVNLTNVDIHGLAARGIFGIHNGDWTLTNSKIMTGGKVGWDSDGPSADDSYTGTTTFQTGTKVDWNGCGERYPLQSSDLDSPLNIHHCWEQSQGGYGDGIGLGDGDPGNWVVTDSSVSWNTSDGLDLAHSRSTGRSVNISRSRFEGNNGNQVKITTNTGNIENSLIMGNCGFFAGQTFTSTKGNDGSDTNMNFCRASGAAITLNMGDTVDYNIYGNTILANGDTTINYNGTSCTNAHLRIANNIIRAGKDFNADTTNPYAATPGPNDNSEIFYAGGSGNCASLTPVESYNICYGGKDAQCSGTHDQEATDPLFAGTIKMGPYNTVGYYTGADYYKQVHILNAAPEVGTNSADETITLHGTSNDATNAVRGAQWDTGAYEYGSNDWGGSIPSIRTHGLNIN